MSALMRLTGFRSYSQVDSIVRNLNSVLNSYKDFGSCLPSFGLGAYEERWSGEEILNVLAGEIVDNVRKFEPRVERPEVNFLAVDEDRRASFALSGEVEGVSRTFYVAVELPKRATTVEIL
ncbi:MAG: GPW/gp25 family protein [Myxococcota bacterium]